MSHNLNPSQKTFTLKSGVQLVSTPALSSGNITQYSLRDQGLEYFTYADIVVDRFGKSIYPSLEYLFEMISPRMMSIPNTIMKVKVGRDLKYPGNIHGTVTANGVGLSSVEIQVSVGGGSLVDWYSVNRVIVAPNGRQFRVIATAKDPAGYQRITLEPSNAKKDLVVNGGMSRDFPTNTQFGELGTYAPIGDNCDQPYSQRHVWYDENEFRVFKTQWQFTRDSEALKNKPVGTDAYFYHYYNGQQITENGNFVVSYINDQEIKQQWAFDQERFFNLLYLEENLNSNADIFGGPGLTPQIPKEFQAQWTPDKFNLKNLQEVISFWAENNTSLASQTGQIHCFLGNAIYHDITQSIGVTTEFAIQNRMEPNTTFEQARKEYVLGRQWKGFTHNGYDVIFHNIPQLSQTWYNPRRSPKYNGSSIGTHECFLMDLDSLSNPDLVTGMQAPEKGWHKIQTFTRGLNGDLSDFMQDNWTKGRVNPDGTNIQGEVYSLNKGIRRVVECVEGIALLDKTAVFRISMQ